MSDRPDDVRREVDEVAEQVNPGADEHPERSDETERAERMNPGNNDNDDSSAELHDRVEQMSEGSPDADARLSARTHERADTMNPGPNDR